MQRIKRQAVVLLCALLFIMAFGCQDRGPEEEQPQFLLVPEGRFLPIAERPKIIPFDGIDLSTGEQVALTVAGEGRVRMLSFFSSG